MSINDQQAEALLAEMRKMTDAVTKGSGSLFANVKSERANTKDDIAFKAAVKEFEYSTKGMKYVSKEFPKQLESAFTASSSKFVQGFASEVKTLEDVFAAESKRDALVELAAGIKSLNDKQLRSSDEFDKELDKLGGVAKRAGTTLKEFNIVKTRVLDKENKTVHIINAGQTAFKNVTKEAVALSGAINTAAAATEKHTERVEFIKNKYAGLGSSLLNAGKIAAKLAENEGRFAQQNATADAGFIKGIERMSISQLEYMKVLKDTRIQSLASATAGTNFNATLEASKKSLEGLTLDYNEASKVAVMNYKNMSAIGVSQDDLGDAVVEQTKLYNDNFRALGFSAEAFAQLSTDLINDKDMRGVLLGLQEKERKAYVMGAQRRMAEYVTMGYTIERAKELQKTFQSLNKMNPKERMKQSAKKRAMLGALGMGSEGEELFKLETSYRTMNAEQKKAADIRMTEIQGQASAKFGEMSGSGVGIGQAFSMQMLAEKTGFNTVVETFERVSGEGRVIDIKLLNKTNELADTGKKVLGGLSTLEALSNSAATSLGTNLVGDMGKMLMGRFTKNFISSLVSSGVRGGGAAGMVTDALGGLAKGGFWRLLGGVGAAGAFGYGLGTIISKSLDDSTNEYIGNLMGNAVDDVGRLLGVIEEKKFAPLKDITERKGYGDTQSAAQLEENKLKIAERNDIQRRMIAQEEKTRSELAAYKAQIDAQGNQTAEQTKAFHLLAKTTAQAIRENNLAYESAFRKVSAS